MSPRPKLSRDRRWSALRTPPLVLPLLTAVLLVIGAAVAQGSLYGPEAPADVAFLRVLNASSGSVDASIGDGEATELPPGAGTPYAPVPTDEARFVVTRPGSERSETASPTLGAEAFATLLVTDDGVRVLDDEVLRDISRGLLVFVNAAGTPLSLRTADGTVVFEAVGETPASRTITEAEAAFEVVDPATGEVVAGLEGRTYGRGAAHTILVREGADGLAASYVAASAAD